ncbi:hypothetical protein [Domibacillus iocasae]|uniref:Uncharacterized protein n=1 Tax=Domibacillus iocasae TaxID=1714016 RepID=A0A1E7DSY2_9BACI|nr:hypothetical protein [Domibacillus iocasae]OES45798.1 hypothetical protein BA724_03055 [Domibacillus iocasae]
MQRFQKIMNQSRDDLRKTKWKDHREQVTGLFDEVFSKREYVNKIGVFGAGNCDDLDIEYLSSKANSIYLIDVDLESMKNGIKDLPESVRIKIELVELDVTGLNEINFYNNFASLLEKKGKAKKIVKYLIEISNSLERISRRSLNDLNKDFDIIASSAIYTQLFYNWAFTILSEYQNKYDKKEYNKILDGIIFLRNKIIVAYNDSLFDMCGENGFLISWSDALPIRPGYIPIINKGLKEALALVSSSGYQAALIGIQDIVTKIEVSSLLTRYWKWDFSENKEYLTFGICGEIKKN